MRAKSKVAKALAAKWEGSPKDKAKDKREDKKHHMPVKKWEGSKADEKMDKAMQKKMAKKKGK